MFFFLGAYIFLLFLSEWVNDWQTLGVCSGLFHVVFFTIEFGIISGLLNILQVALFGPQLTKVVSAI